MIILENATIVDAVTGRVKFMFRHVPETLVQDNLTDADVYLAISAPTSDCYWNFDTWQFDELPPCPSDAHIFDYATKEWYDPRTLDDLKAHKWTELKRQRDAFEFGGFTWNGNVYDSDRTSQARILMASLSSSPQTWTLADNNIVELSAADLVQLADALRSHIATAHARGRSARAVLEAATSADEVNSVVF